MKCPRCQAENREGARFCRECGATFGGVCSSCGAKVEAGSKFCDGCGASLAAIPVPGLGPSRFASPESYTPKHLAEKILTSKNALEGERKQVTVLFADLKGSMELLADRDPEEARKLLDPVLERMMEAVHRYEGTVNQVMGDGIMALFGAPLAHEDHAVRACYAALRMQESVKRYGEGVFRRFGVPVEIRVGLNSGEVVVRAIGSDLHMDYTAVGQTTHLAARMEQMARPGTILLAPDTLALSEGFVQVTSRGPVPVKGLAAPIEIFELAGASPARSRLHATAARGLTRFVGRDAELELLRRALGRAGQGQGQVVAIVGEPGVGKSRLVWEFTHSHRSQEWLVLEATSVSYGKATTYYPVIELLRRYFQIEAQDDNRKMREKVTGKLLSLDRALEPMLSVFLSLLDVPVTDAEWTKLDPAQRRRQTLDALKRLLLRESQVQPVLLVVEDLHWIDSETQAWLDLLIDSLPTTRLLLLVNYRPEYMHGWGSKTYYQQVRLDALTTASAEELLEALLGTGPGLADLRQLLIDRTQGNAFFLEESVRALVETGALNGERGAYRLAGPVRNLQLPATAQAILAARIDRLAPEDKRLLQAAAVVGTDVPFPLLEAIAEEPEDRLRHGLARLQATELLYEARLFPDLEYTFKHALTHEVAYGGLLQDRRRRLHAQILEAMEKLYRDRLDEHVERLAHHAVRGEVWQPAVMYLRQAGTKGMARSANREAVNCFEEALTCLQHLRETRETLEQAIDLRFDLRTALFPLCEFERIFGYLRDAEGLARTLDDQPRLGQMFASLCMNLWTTGHPKEALASGQSAQGIAESLGDVPLQVMGNHHLGVACLGIGDYPRAEDLLRKALRLLEGDRRRGRFGAGFPSVMARVHLIWIFADQGKFKEGIAYGQEGIRLAEALDNPYSLAYVCWILAYLQITRGGLSHAVGLLERGLALSREWNLTLFSVIHTGILGYAYALSGRIAEGIPLLEHALSAIEAMGIGSVQSLHLRYVGEAYVLADRLEDALAFGGRALTLARERGQRPFEAGALRLLGDVTARRGLPEQADGHYRDAIALAAELKMRPLVAHCHLGLGKLDRRLGKREQAQEHLTTATTMYREMDMQFWLEQTAAERKGLP
jgi:class 3 adenylate cyclase/tetratricopeptide (TPR) repeat protein